MKRKRTTNKPDRIIPDKSLPVRLRSDDILKHLASNDVLIIIAETGSGKTTQIPQIILENQESSSILVTQPRRVAAISVAARVSAERGCTLGDQVGYSVRFDDKSSRETTRIRYVTDGVMLREALSSGITGLRNRYSHVIIDEIHERSVNTDIVLGIVKRILLHSTSTTSTSNASSSPSGIAKLLVRSKLPFKVILMSATTDAEKLRHFFTHDTKLNVSLLDIEGKAHPVRILSCTQPVPDFVDASVDTSMRIMKENQSGDILVFLPGQEDITAACTLLRKRLKERRSKEEWRYVQIHSLFSAMPADDQLRALLPLPDEYKENGFKVIFATNIAETSITIPGIRFVVDTGLMKVRETSNAKGKMKGDLLQLHCVSRAQADQRKGRAGRTGPGFVYRLYTEQQFNDLRLYPTPEILRSEATGTLLQITALVYFFQKKLKESSSKNSIEKVAEEEKRMALLNFPLIDKIPQREIEFGLETLVLLGAVDQTMKLTKTGELMSRLPVSPMLARSLLESVRLGCIEAMASVGAVLSVDGTIFQEAKGPKKEKILNAHKRFMNLNGDHLTSANALHGVWELQGNQARIEFCKSYFLNYRSIISAISIRGQLLKILQNGDMTSWGLRSGLSADVEADVQEASMDELVRRCLVAGFFRNIAQKCADRGYVAIGRGGLGEKELKGNRGDIHPSCVLQKLRKKREPELMLYNEFVATSKPYFRTVTAIERRWMSQHTSYFESS